MAGEEIKEVPVVQSAKKCPEIVNLLFGSDKNFVIFAVLAIVIYSLYTLGIQAKEIASNALSGLFGIAVGQKLNP